MTTLTVRTNIGASTQGVVQASIENLWDMISETIGSTGGAINPASASTIDNMAIGGTTPKSGAFTTLTELVPENRTGC